MAIASIGQERVRPCRAGSRRARRPPRCRRRAPASATTMQRDRQHRGADQCAGRARLAEAGAEPGAAAADRRDRAAAEQQQAQPREPAPRIVTITTMPTASAAIAGGDQDAGGRRSGVAAPRIRGRLGDQHPADEPERERDHQRVEQVAAGHPPRLPAAQGSRSSPAHINAGADGRADARCRWRSCARSRPGGAPSGRAAVSDADQPAIDGDQRDEDAAGDEAAGGPGARRRPGAGADGDQPDVPPRPPSAPAAAISARTGGKCTHQLCRIKATQGGRRVRRTPE